MTADEKPEKQYTLYRIGDGEPKVHATGTLYDLLTALHKAYPKVGIIADTGIVLDNLPNNGGKPAFILHPPATDKEIRAAQGVKLMSDVLRESQEVIDNPDSHVSPDSKAAHTFPFPKVC